MPLLNAAYYQGEISRLIGAAGQTVQIVGGGSCTLLREEKDSKTLEAVAALGGSDGLKHPAVWYARASDYAASFGSGDAQGIRFIHRSVTYRVVRATESEDGDTLQFVTILTDRDSP